MEDGAFRVLVEHIFRRVCIFTSLFTPHFVTEVGFSLDVGESLFENQFLPTHLALLDGLNSDVAVFNKFEGTFNL